MAAVNFTNLATARAGQRAREVALRKVLGARRRQLVAQFLGESILLTAVAMLLALALVELLLPAFSAFLDSDLKIAYFGADGILVPAILLVLVVGAAGGVYPALYLSRYQPAAVLRANKSYSETPGSGRLRNLLVVAQFAVSIGLIICTVIVYHQTLFASRSSAGFDREGLIQLEGLRRPEIASQRETLVREIERVPGVTGVSGTNIVPAIDQSFYTMVGVPGKPEPEKIGWYSVEPDFFATLRVPILAGRSLSDRYAEDKAYVPGGDYQKEASAAALRREIAARGVNIVVNKAAAERLGFAGAADAVGKRIGLSLDGDEYGIAQATIVGVAANSRFRSLREPIEPTIYYDTGDYRRLIVRYENADPSAVRSAIEQIWRRLAPQVPLEADFTEEKIAKQYWVDARRGQTFAGFAFIAVLIACLGLFGLAAFTAERRTKEIGIRKVFGATVRDIVKLLVWQFSKPVVIANLVAWPVAWWVMRDWLNQFDERIALTPGPFLLAGLLALGIAVGTVAGHAMKVARQNPIHALRYE
jgi:putative ABC transport system permease protein